jgi:hypothetical protein
VASIVGRADIAIALAPSSSPIAIVSPTCRPLPSSCPRTVHCYCAPLSITVELLLYNPCHCTCTVPCRPSLLRSRHAVPCRQGAVSRHDVHCRCCCHHCDFRFCCCCANHHRCAIHCHRCCVAVMPSIAVAVTPPFAAIAVAVAIPPSIAVAVIAICVAVTHSIAIALEPTTAAVAPPLLLPSFPS